MSNIDLVARMTDPIQLLDFIEGQLKETREGFAKWGYDPQTDNLYCINEAVLKLRTCNNKRSQTPKYFEPYRKALNAEIQRVNVITE